MKNAINLQKSTFGRHQNIEVTGAALVFYCRVALCCLAFMLLGFIIVSNYGFIRSFSNIRGQLEPFAVFASRIITEVLSIPVWISVVLIVD